jgi:diacylglycerol kinase
LRVRSDSKLIEFLKMDPSGKTDFVQSVRHALRGCKMLFGSERNAKIHLTVFVLVVIAGIYFPLSKMEWIAILLASGVVIAAEAMNTAIEGTIDLLHPQRHEKAGRIKDIAAGAVLIVTAAAIATGLIIFLPKITALL